MSEKEVIDCDLTDGKVRKFRKGPGLFDRGIKKVNTYGFDEQEKRIVELSYVKAFNSEKKEAKVSLGWAGDYVIEIKWRHPIVHRIESNGRRSGRNPFIAANYKLCLGSTAPLYHRCFSNKNYLECIKIAAAVLQSPDTDRTYRSWSDCGGYEKEKVYI